MRSASRLPWWDHVREAAPTLKAKRVSDRHRTGERTRLERRPDLVADVLRLVHPRPVGKLSRSTASARWKPSEFMVDLHSAGRAKAAAFGWGCGRRTTSSLLVGSRVADHERDSSDRQSGGSRDAVRRTTSGSGPFPRGARSGGARARPVHERQLRSAASRRTGRRLIRFIADLCLASGAGGGRRRGSSTSRAFRAPIPLDEDLQKGCSDGHTGGPGGSIDSRRPSRRSSRETSDTPGHANPAVGEVFDRFLIPRMFAQVAQGKLSAAESVSATATEMRGIWSKWRKAGQI